MMTQMQNKKTKNPNNKIHNKEKKTVLEGPHVDSGGGNSSVGRPCDKWRRKKLWRLTKTVKILSQ